MAADPADRPGTGQPGRASTSTRGWSTGCSRAASSPSRRSTTGTCRRRSRTPAAGPIARDRRRVRRVRRASWARRSATGCTPGRRSTSRGARRTSGYGPGVHAPGRHEPAAALAAVHHLNLAHGLADPGAARDARPATPEYSVTLNLHVLRGVGRRRGARRCAGSTPSPTGSSSARCCAAPTRRTCSPTRHPSPTGRSCRTATSTTINQPLDVLGVNYYSTATVQLWDGVSPKQHDRRSRAPRAAPPWPGSDARRVRRAARARTPRWAGTSRRRASTSCSSSLPEQFPDQPLMITENGAAFDDVVADGRLGARRRARRLPAPPHRRRRTGPSSAASTCAATSSGRCWTTSSGATATPKRFGIVRVDYDTLERTVKDSGLWYRNLVATRSIPA